MITLSKEDYEKIVSHSKKELPKEACGLLAGIIENGNKIIKKVYLLTNIDQSKEHFSLEPKEQFIAVKDMRAKGYEPLGNWHSHPNTPAIPSKEDIRLAYDSSASYMILSLMERDALVLNSFQIEGNQVEKEEVIIRDYSRITE